MERTPPTPPDAGPPFSDARGCKVWLGGLPLTNVAAAKQHVLDGLLALPRGVTGGLERLKCLELVREKIAYLLHEQRSRYFGKTLPLSQGDEKAWSVGRSLLETMESGYQGCLGFAPLEKGELAQHVPLMMQRIIRCIGSQMLFHLMVYRRFDSALWVRLHELYATAERDGIADERVKDGVESADGVSSIHESYVHVVLTQAAYLAEMTAPQMDFVGSLLRVWPRKVHIYAEPPADAGSGKSFPLAVDLARPIGARPLRADERLSTHRILDVAELSKSIRRRLKGLQSGETLIDLGLPVEARIGDAFAQLARLHRLWCEGAPLRPSAKAPDERISSLAFGLPAIHFFVTGGAVFEQPDRDREFTSREKDDLAVFGRVSERTQELRAAEHRFDLEYWGVVDEALGMWRLLRPKKATRGVAIGRILAMRLGESAPFLLGNVHALVQESDGQIVITVALYPGRPEPIAVRAADVRNRLSSQWSPAFRMPPLERLNIPQSLLVPTGIASRGRGIELWQSGAKEATVHEVLERGTDFDRVTCF